MTDRAVGASAERPGGASAARSCPANTPFPASETNRSGDAAGPPSAGARGATAGGEPCGAIVRRRRIGQQAPRHDGARFGHNRPRFGHNRPRRLYDAGHGAADASDGADREPAAPRHAAGPETGFLKRRLWHREQHGIARPQRLGNALQIGAGQIGAGQIGPGRRHVRPPAPRYGGCARHTPGAGPVAGPGSPPPASDSCARSGPRRHAPHPRHGAVRSPPRE